MYRYEISIVIASIGRNSLKRVIKEILEDRDDLSLQIVVVADGQEALERINAFSLSKSHLEVISNTRTKGVSGALNTGLLHAEGKYLMLFSDDDYWPRGKLRKSIESMLGKEKTCVCFQVETLSKSGKIRIRPSFLPKLQIDPISYCYEKSPLLSNPRYISLTSFIAPIEVRENLFPEDLKSREDLVWLNSISMNGFKIYLLQGICARVEIGYERTSERDDHLELSLWLEWLKENKPEVITNFLYGHFLRPYVVSKNIFLGIKVLRKAKVWRYKPKLKNLISFAFLVILGLIQLVYSSIFNNNVIKRIRELFTFVVL